MFEKHLPDVAKESNAEKFHTLKWVGMREIEVPLLVAVNGEKMRVPARAEAKVSLDKQASRGIHMSRLYVIVQEQLAKNILTSELLAQISAEFLHSHAELSSSSFVSVNFQMPLLRKALKSDNYAWRTYPVLMTSENHCAEIKNFVETVVTYSSTCPASAALSRQLIQENFKNTFVDGNIGFEQVHQWLGTTAGIVATPHAQRSFARVKVQVIGEFSTEALIDLIEEALQTAVQGAVKREDEQEFALRNGQNLMFCEDAARRVKAALDVVPELVDYLAEFNHVESLHPHSAVSLVTKGKDLQSF